jgi:hypothetical protein
MGEIRGEVRKCNISRVISDLIMGVTKFTSFLISPIVHLLSPYAGISFFTDRQKI